jgi:hypothetical protein
MKETSLEKPERTASWLAMLVGSVVLLFTLVAPQDIFAQGITGSINGIAAAGRSLPYRQPSQL